jgi:flagellar protein FlgJ
MKPLVLGGKAGFSAMDAKMDATTENIRKGLEQGQNKELRRACQDFEAMFIYKLLQQMRRAVPKSGLFPDSHQKEMYQSMFDIEVSEQMARAKGIGLADRLYEDISRNLNQNSSNDNKMGVLKNGTQR